MIIVENSVVKIELSDLNSIFNKSKQVAMLLTLRHYPEQIQITLDRQTVEQIINHLSKDKFISIDEFENVIEPFKSHTKGFESSPNEIRGISSTSQLMNSFINFNARVREVLKRKKSPAQLKIEELERTISKAQEELKELKGTL